MNKQNNRNDTLDMMASITKLIRNSVMDAAKTGKSTQVIIPPPQPKQCKKNITSPCDECEREFNLNELTDWKCKYCICNKIKEQVLYCDEFNMTLSERVNLFNEVCLENNVKMTRHIFNYLKNLYKIKDECVMFDIKNKVMKVRKGHGDEPCN
jgi:hypothetical protein